MDAVVMFNGSLDQYSSLPPYKSNLRNLMKIHYPFLSMPSENFLPSHFPTTGLLQAPPPFLSQSFPPPYSSNQQPPLLPLPAATPRRSAAAYSSPSKKTGNGNRTRVSSPTPKKSKSAKKKEERNSPKKPIIASNNPTGPDPKDVAKVLPLFSSSSGNIHYNAKYCINNIKSFSKAVEDEVEMFSGSAVFSISPPPSSLPLPTFSLRPKLSCTAEAAVGIDSGATDDLRRLLRLR